jgi:hypothetical protein
VLPFRQSPHKLRLNSPEQLARKQQQMRLSWHGPTICDKRFEIRK